MVNAKGWKEICRALLERKKRGADNYKQHAFFRALFTRNGNQSLLSVYSIDFASGRSYSLSGVEIAIFLWNVAKLMLLQILYIPELTVIHYIYVTPKYSSPFSGANPPHGVPYTFPVNV